ncbi:hypothetical protein [Streptomyces fradiae]|uniref:hypothetical protein n=1 Tax=Streptomyces fradiae TaxID=1906 RepID=UPI00365F49E7
MNWSSHQLGTHAPDRHTNTAWNGTSTSPAPTSRAIGTGISGDSAGRPCDSRHGGKCTWRAEPFQWWASIQSPAPIRPVAFHASNVRCCRR